MFVRIRFVSYGAMREIKRHFAAQVGGKCAMIETITLKKSVLAGVLDALGYPHPDDPGPYGPIGPVIRDLLRVLLNPQPLPPRAGPSPEPWRAAMLARTFIDRIVAQYQSAEVLGGTEQSAKAIGTIRSYISDVVDDWCGTRPPKWPWPWRPQFDAAQTQPISLLVAGAQFQTAAALDSPLQADFSAAADRLFETGLKRLDASLSERRA